MVDSAPLSSFISIPVPGNKDDKISIKKFVETNKIEFKAGSGYYELSKPEIIQTSKTILVQRISDPNQLIFGPSIRKVLNIDDKKKASKDKYTIDEDILKEFRVFVQSTSYNRNLIGGTTFLYQKEGTDPFNKSSSSPPSKPGASKSDDGAPHAKKSKADNGSSSVTGLDIPVEVIISFDTTGSMYPCLSTVRSVLRDTLKTLMGKIPNIRIGIVAHGDYCDARTSYVIKAANNYKFCNASQMSDLIDFVTNCGSTGGGDLPECYELVLHEVANKFDWTPEANKSLILIGDAEPHPADDTPKNLDWRKEAQTLKEKGIRVYAVQALDHYGNDSFYKELAQITCGFHLRLYQLSAITEFLVAVCYKEGDNSSNSNSNYLGNYEDQLTASGKMVSHLRRLFDQLQGRATSTAVSSTHDNDELTPVNPSRFQVLLIDEDQPIKQFAESRGLIFKTGRGFYEFTKAEAISDKKEIILMDKTNEDFYTGWKAARELAGIEPQGKSKGNKQRPKDCDKYIVFVQSTSYNRKLIAGQRFLYETDPDH